MRPRIAASRRILVCPDALKETASARDAADAIAKGVREALPDAEVRCVPLADGGEGTLDVLGSTRHDLVASSGRVPGPRPDRPEIDARFAVSTTTGLAVVELADAAGLARLAVEDRDPERTGTAGVGRLLDLARRAAVDTGHPIEIVLALGGSGTVDGGLGAVRALGVEIIGPGGDSTRPLVGADLASVRGVRIPAALRERWAEVRLRVLADVRNPLTGPLGAARVFGPQKGATPAAVDRLESGLVRWGGLLAERFGVDPTAPGTGAAGGIGIALAAFLGATIEPGFEVIAAMVGLDQAIAESDLVITSEGRLDRQSVMGKVIGGVLDRADRVGVPVMAVPGSVEDPLPDDLRGRFTAIRSLEETVGPVAARCRPLEALRQATATALRDR